MRHDFFIDFLEKNRGCVLCLTASWDQRAYFCWKSSFEGPLKTEIRPVHQIHQQIGKSV